MIGNLSSMLFNSIDKWFVKFLLPVENFSYYSFAISMIGIITILINSIAMTFYPYFSKGYESNQIREIKKYLIIIGAIASSGYFVLFLVVSNFLENYIPSLEVIAVLFVSFPAIAVINVLYVNLFKVNKEEKKYFYKVLMMLVIATLLNVVAVLIDLSNFSIAIATSVAYYYWFFSSSRDFDGLETNSRKLYSFQYTFHCFIYKSLFELCNRFYSFHHWNIYFNMGCLQKGI